MIPNCVMCDRSEDRHEGVKHPFTPEGQDPGTKWLTPTSPVALAEAVQDGEPTASSLPFDPVLRTALIAKGILTIEDLVSAERQIRAIGGALNGL